MNGDYKQATKYLTVLEDGFRYEFLGGCTDQRACISDVKQEMPTSKSTLVARSALAEETAPAVDIVMVLPL